MSAKETLEKAIQKAIDGGFDPEPYFKTLHPDVRAIADNPLQYGLIFNHDFAKSLWGESGDKVYEICRTDHDKTGYCGDYDCRDYEYKEGWMNHLQQMVISDDPIKYLGDNL